MNNNNKIIITYGTSVIAAKLEAELLYRHAKAEGILMPEHAKVGYLDDHLVSVQYEDFSTGGIPKWAYQITHPKSEKHPNGAKTTQGRYDNIYDALKGAESFYNNHILPEQSEKH